MSFESLDMLLSTVWHSLDDIFVCIGFFLTSQVIANSVRWSLLNYFKCSHYTSQIFHFGFLFLVFIFLVGHLIGSSTATSLFSGFSIGFGYAMQPYIVSLLAGASFRSGSMFRANDLLRINGEDYVLEHVGLLYLCASSGGYKTYFPNSMLTQTPIAVKAVKAA